MKDLRGRERPRWSAKTDNDGEPGWLWVKPTALGLFVLAVLVALGSHKTAQQPAEPAQQQSAPPVSETRLPNAFDSDDRHAVVDAHLLLQNQLRDPDSAIFDKQRSWMQEPEVYVRRVNGTPTRVCGWVNARNGLGGMTGDQPYVVNVQTGGVIVNASSSEIMAACGP